MDFPRRRAELLASLSPEGRATYEVLRAQLARDVDRSFAESKTRLEKAVETAFGDLHTNLDRTIADLRWNRRVNGEPAKEIVAATAPTTPAASVDLNLKRDIDHLVGGPAAPTSTSSDISIIPLASTVIDVVPGAIDVDHDMVAVSHATLTPTTCWTIGHGFNNSSICVREVSATMEGVSHAAPTPTEGTATPLLPVLKVDLLAPIKCSTECPDVGTHTMMPLSRSDGTESATTTTVILRDTQLSSLPPRVPESVWSSAQLDAANKLFDENPQHADVDFVALLQLNTGQSIVPTFTGSQPAPMRPMFSWELDAGVIGIVDITKLDASISRKAFKVRVPSIVDRNSNGIGDERRPPWPPPELVKLYRLGGQCMQPTNARFEASPCLGQLRMFMFVVRECTDLNHASASLPMMVVSSPRLEDGQTSDSECSARVPMEIPYASSREQECMVLLAGIHSSYQVQPWNGFVPDGVYPSSSEFFHWEIAWALAWGYSDGCTVLKKLVDVNNLRSPGVHLSVQSEIGVQLNQFCQSIDISLGEVFYMLHCSGASASLYGSGYFSCGVALPIQASILYPSGLVESISWVIAWLLCVLISCSSFVNDQFRSGLVVLVLRLGNLVQLMSCFADNTCVSASKYTTPNCSAAAAYVQEGESYLVECNITLATMMDAKLMQWKITWFQFFPSGSTFLYSHGSEQFPWEISWPLKEKCSEIAGTKLMDLLLHSRDEEIFGANFIVVTSLLGLVAAWYMFRTRFRRTNAHFAELHRAQCRDPCFFIADYVVLLSPAKKLDQWWVLKCQSKLLEVSSLTMQDHPRPNINYKIFKRLQLQGNQRGRGVIAEALIISYPELHDQCVYWLLPFSHGLYGGTSHFLQATEDILCMKIMDRLVNPCSSCFFQQIQIMIASMPYLMVLFPWDPGDLAVVIEGVWTLQKFPQSRTSECFWVYFAVQQTLQQTWDPGEPVLDWAQFDVQVPWDPGGSTWSRLEDKPNFMEGGLSATSRQWAAVGPWACQETTTRSHYKYTGDGHERVGWNRTAASAEGLAWLG